MIIGRIAGHASKDVNRFQKEKERSQTTTTTTLTNTLFRCWLDGSRDATEDKSGSATVSVYQENTHT